MLRTHCAHDCNYAAQTGKHLLRTQNVSERNQKHFCVSDTNFVSATNVARTGKRGNICVRNIVSSFATAFTSLQIFMAKDMGESYHMKVIT